MWWWKIFCDLFRSLFDGDDLADLIIGENNANCTIGIIGEYNFITFIKEKLKNI